MATDVRPARSEEMEDFVRIRSYAFADHRNLVPPLPEELSYCAFLDGKLASISGAWPFTVRWNGAAVAAAGVTMVATAPEHRRRGLLRAIMQRALPAFRERGQPIAMLWASFGAIYQRFGFGPASHTSFYRIDPRWARLLDESPSPGRVEVLPAAKALSLIKPIYIAHASTRTLLLHRASVLWQFSLLQAQEGEGVFAAIYRDAEGTPRGYAVYETTGPGIQSGRTPDTISPFQELTVRDWIVDDAETYRALWRFLCSHDLVQTIRMGPLPMDDPAPLLLAEPRKLLRRVNDGIWLRIVDAERALSARGYTEVGQLTLEIPDDALCPWNKGRYSIHVGEDGAAHIERTRDACDLTLPPRSLATLLSGHASASDLYRAGLLDAKDPVTLATANRLFATQHRPHCPDSF